MLDSQNDCKITTYMSAYIVYQFQNKNGDTVGEVDALEMTGSWMVIAFYWENQETLHLRLILWSFGPLPPWLSLAGL